MALKCTGRSKRSPFRKNGDPEKEKILAEHAKDAKNYTHSGMPSSLYSEDGTKYNTDYLDEGNLSAIHRVHKHGEYVTPIESGTSGDNIPYRSGQKLFLKNPIKK